MDWTQIGSAAAVTTLGFYEGWRYFKERRGRRKGLLGNPARCQDHETRLREVEKCTIGINAVLPMIRDDIAEIKESLRDFNQRT